MIDEMNETIGGISNVQKVDNKRKEEYMENHSTSPWKKTRQLVNEIIDNGLLIAQDNMKLVNVEHIPVKSLIMATVICNGGNQEDVLVDVNRIETCLPLHAMFAPTNK